MRSGGNRFELVVGDLRHEKTVRDALKGCDTVIHLGAISNDPTGDVDEVLTRQVNFDAIGCCWRWRGKRA